MAGSAVHLVCDFKVNAVALPLQKESLTFVKICLIIDTGNVYAVQAVIKRRRREASAARPSQKCQTLPKMSNPWYGFEAFSVHRENPRNRKEETAVRYGGDINRMKPPSNSHGHRRAAPKAPDRTPVLNRTFDGRRRAARFVKPLTVTAAAAALVFLGALGLDPAMVNPGSPAVMLEQPVPLAGWAGHAVAGGRVFWQDTGGGIADIRLVLVDADGAETAWAAVTDETGAYMFQGMPDGEYLLRADLPDGMAAADGDERIVVEGRAGFVLDENGKREADGVNIPIYKTA
jgi:hypothetical protein